MDRQNEDPRLRALLLASRNQLDSLWRVVERVDGNERNQMEMVLKLIGAIDYALEIESYTFDVETIPGRVKTPAPAPVPAAATQRPVAPNGNHSVSHPLDINGGQ